MLPRGWRADTVSVPQPSNRGEAQQPPTCCSQPIAAQCAAHRSHSETRTVEVSPQSSGASHVPAHVYPAAPLQDSPKLTRSHRLWLAHVERNPSPALYRYSGRAGPRSTQAYISLRASDKFTCRRVRRALLKLPPRQIFRDRRLAMVWCLSAQECAKSRGKLRPKLNASLIFPSSAGYRKQWPYSDMF